MSADDIELRETVTASDVEAVRRITQSSGFFYPEEIDIAVELVEERLAKGEKSGYFFLFASIGGEVAGYACFGPIACTKTSFDLFWIAVDERYRGKGLGKVILAQSEKIIARMGGKRVYVETSNRPFYEPTRQFYLKTDYIIEAVIKDFYNEGDDKVVFVKKVG
jgi:GNAT superfamily N-acetyltransferase